MNRGSEEGGGLTEVGGHGFFMAYSHVGHDCRVGEHVIFANCATLGGHCVIGDHVFMGGLSAVHQFSWIGAYALIAGLTTVRRDVIPFARAYGNVGRLNGINSVGMQRRQFSRETIREVRQAYRVLFHGDGLLQEKIEAVEKTYGADVGVAAILAFIRAPRKRPLSVPRAGLAED